MLMIALTNDHVAHELCSRKQYVTLCAHEQRSSRSNVVSNAHDIYITSQQTGGTESVTQTLESHRANRGFREPTYARALRARTMYTN